MSTLLEPISKIKARFEQWARFSNTGAKVQDIALDYINRAKDWLCEYRSWDRLKRQVALTLASDLSSLLPSDLVSILAVWCDSNGDGKPDWYYYRDHTDVAHRYTVAGEFDPTVGHSLTIQFPSGSNLSGSPVLEYSTGISDYTGNETEYSFFPPSLLLRCAQKIYCEDKGKTGDDEQLLINAFWEDLRRYEQNVQHSNTVMDLTLRDAAGNPMRILGHAMDGSGGSPTVTPYVPSTWFHGA